MGSLVGFFLFFFWGTPMPVTANSRSEPSSASTLVFALLQNAKAAQEGGQAKRAQQYWLHAKRLNPSLRKPVWLFLEEYHVVPATIPKRQLLLKNASHPLDPQVKASLETLLESNPMDAEVRQVLLRLAQRQGKAGEIRRHQAILKPETESTRPDWMKLALAAILMGGSLWCLFAPLPGSKTVIQPQGETLYRYFLNSVRRHCGTKLR